MSHVRANDTAQPRGKRPLLQQLSVVTSNVSNAPLVVADRPVFHRCVRIAPFLIDECVAVNEPRDLLIAQALPPQIERYERVPVPRRLDRPLALRTTQAAAAIEVGKPPDEPLTASDIGKSIDDELKLEGLDPDVLADAADLRHPPAVPQKKVLLAVDDLQKRLPATDLAERDDSAQPLAVDIPDVGM